MASKAYTNLLPQEEQREISLERIQAHVLNFFILVLASLILISSLFLVGRSFLHSRIGSLQQEIADQQKLVSKQDNQKLKNEIDRLNRHLNNLVTLQDHQGEWSEVLIAFARLVPAKVAIDSFTASRETGIIKISGFAKTREAALQLRANLLASPYFKNVDFPLSNLDRAQDAQFHYSFTVVPDQLVKGIPKN